MTVETMDSTREVAKGALEPGRMPHPASLDCLPSRSQLAYERWLELRGRCRGD